jgi:hypothetical protein
MITGLPTKQKTPYWEQDMGILREFSMLGPPWIRGLRRNQSNSVSYAEKPTRVKKY